MTDNKVIANIFNGVMKLYKGEEPIGLKVLYKEYQEYPMFLALISNLDEANRIPIPKVMQEVYDFYKKYREKELTDSDWEVIIDETRDIAKKWENNKWCKRVIIELMNLLDADDRERRKIEKEIAQEMEAAAGKETKNAA